MEDFYKATPKVSHVINFSTTLGWMWILPDGVNYTYPEDINETDFSYNQGIALRDPSLKEVTDYYARLVAWYVNGGFTDECGVYHHSGHSYTIEYWEVLNEIEAEHSISPNFYNSLYDAITLAIYAVSPDTKFVGLALGDNANASYMDYIETFLNSSQHAADIPPIDFFSYHWYSSPSQGTTEEAAQCFEQADTLLEHISTIESIRQSLAPNTKTTLNEIGTFDPLGTTSIVEGYEVPPEYFVWSDAIFAYVWSGVVQRGIDVVGESQLVGYPGQYPSISMVNYTTGNPNARLRVLQLLQKNFGPGDQVVETSVEGDASGNFYAQAFVTKEGKRKRLVVNKVTTAQRAVVRGVGSGNVEIVDLSTGEGEWRVESWGAGGEGFELTGWATVVFTES